MDDEDQWRSGELRCFSSRNYERFVAYDVDIVARSRSGIWRILWRRIKREKKRMFSCSNSNLNSAIRFSYDPCSYAQNFDQGVVWADPDDISRSFSARFAVSSRFFEKNGLVV